MHFISVTAHRCICHCAISSQELDDYGGKVFCDTYILAFCPNLGFFELKFASLA